MLAHDLLVSGWPAMARRSRESPWRRAMAAEHPMLGTFYPPHLDVSEFQTELERLRAERERWLYVQHQLMELLRADKPDQLVHHLRNVLNERDLLRALLDLDRVHSLRPGPCPAPPTS